MATRFVFTPNSAEFPSSNFAPLAKVNAELTSDSVTFFVAAR
jgi:hypothetical protein